MGHLHRRIKGLQSTKQNLSDTDLEDNIKNVVYCTIVDPSTTKEGKIYLDLCRSLPTTSSRGKKYIYVMYVYACNSILPTKMKNRSDKEMIRAFTELTEDLKIHGINPGFHFADNEASTALKMTTKTMDIKYQLVTKINYIANNVERAIQTFKNYFIDIPYSIDNDFFLQLWEILLHKEIRSLNFLIQSRILTHLSTNTHIFG